MRDMSVGHEATEAALERARRTLLMLTRCNEAILRAPTEERLFAEVCRVIVETGGYRMCWVGVAENDERKTVRPVAHAGHEDGYLATIDVVWADEPRGRGRREPPPGRGGWWSAATSARSRRSLPWREEALRRGYTSSTGLPIAYGGERVGVLTMYSGDARAFSEEELQLLQRLAEDIGFGVVSLRRRREKERAEAALRREPAVAPRALRPQPGRHRHQPRPGRGGAGRQRQLPRDDRVDPRGGASGGPRSTSGSGRTGATGTG